MDTLQAIIAESRRRYRANVMADSPVAYWRLGESSGTTAADETGTYAGTYVASPTLGVAGAVQGNTAVDFNGSSQYVDLGTSSAFNLAAGTYEAWINYATNPAAAATIMCRFRNSTSFFSGPLFYVATDGKLGFGLQNGTSDNYNFLSPSAIAKNQCVHVAATWNSSTAVLYIDGASVASASISGTINVGTNYATSIAARRNPVSGLWERFIDASIDEAAIYGTALSADRIAAHYAAR